MMNRVALALLALANGALAFSPTSAGFLPGRVAVAPATPRVSTSSVEMIVRRAPRTPALSRQDAMLLCRLMQGSGAARDARSGRLPSSSIA